MSESLLKVRDLQVTFGSERGPVRAVRGVDLDVHPGKTLALVGESGSGKSATALGLVGLLPETARVTGEVELRGQSIAGLSEGQWSQVRGQRIGMVFQDPLSALTPLYSVGKQISDAVLVHQRVSRKAAWARAVDLLDLVGIADPGRRAIEFPHQFSGGMRQRVVIALAIANDPDLIIADEPTTALDVTVQAQVLEVLKVAQAETGAGVLLITHDLGVVAGHADDVAVMYAGKVVERGDVFDVFAAPAMPYTLGLRASVPSPDARTRLPLIPIGGEPPSPHELPPGCPFSSRCPMAIDECRTAEPLLTRAGAGHLAACIRSGEVAGKLPEEIFGAGETVESHNEIGDEVVRIEDLSRSYPITKGALLRRRVGTLQAVSDVSFSIRAGETLCLVGESGSGKTTTLLELLQLQRPEHGRIDVLGQEVGTGTSRELRQAVQIVMQDPSTALDPRLPVFELLAEPLRAAKWNAAATRERVTELLELVGLPADSLDRFPAAFSGGQRQRITIARALATGPKLLALDEPVSALDVSVQAEVLNLLAHLQRELGLAYLVVAHDLAVVRHIADRIAVMYLGRIVEIADGETVFRSPSHPYTQALLSAVPIPDPQRERTRPRVILSGEQPSAANLPVGCAFAERCPVRPTLPAEVQERCRAERPELRPTATGARAACHAA